MKNFIIYIIASIIVVTTFVIVDQVGLEKLDEGAPIINLDGK